MWTRKPICATQMEADVAGADDISSATVLLARCRRPSARRRRAQSPRVVVELVVDSCGLRLAIASFAFQNASFSIPPPIVPTIRPSPK
jgi:hypothetical protein